LGVLHLWVVLQQGPRQAAEAELSEIVGSTTDADRVDRGGLPNRKTKIQDWRYSAQSPTRQARNRVQDWLCLQSLDYQNERVGAKGLPRKFGEDSQCFAGGGEAERMAVGRKTYSLESS